MSVGRAAFLSDINDLFQNPDDLHLPFDSSILSVGRSASLKKLSFLSLFNPLLDEISSFSTSMPYFMVYASSGPVLSYLN